MMQHIVIIKIYQSGLFQINVLKDRAYENVRNCEYAHWQGQLIWSISFLIRKQMRG